MYYTLLLAFGLLTTILCNRFELVNQVISSSTIRIPIRMDKHSKIYVAGHRGLVGSSILNQLLSEGYSNIITRTSSELDLRNQHQTNDFFVTEKPEYVFLSAAKVGGIIANNTYRADFIYDNIMIAANVIHASWKHGVQKLLNLGSSCIYPKLAPQPLREEYLLTGELEPTNEPYAIAKIAAIKLCSNYFRQYGANFISLMPSNLYGTNDNFNLETSHVVPALIRKIILAYYLKTKNFTAIYNDVNERPLGFGIACHGMTESSITDILSTLGIKEDSVTIWGSGKPKRELLHAEDLSRAALFFMKNYPASATSEFLNCGAGTDITIHELALLIQKLVGWEGSFMFDTSKPDGTPQKLLDITKAEELGWAPTISLERGIGGIIDNYMKT